VSLSGPAVSLSTASPPYHGKAGMAAQQAWSPVGSSAFYTPSPEQRARLLRRRRVHEVSGLVK
jgi:hypothetical protein